jgi:hypothetical protein
MCWWFSQQLWAVTARLFAHQHRLQVLFSRFLLSNKTVQKLAVQLVGVKECGQSVRGCAQGLM